jgi:D-glycero-D-manno-heptose 1,7-bisphosphate phosphatase
MRMKRALFLDRDGTLIRDVGYPHRAEDLELLPTAVEALRLARGLGYRLVIATNQSGVARGYFGEDEVDAFHQLLRATFAAEGVEFAGIYSCPYHPTEGVGKYRQDSELRKPKPGMLLLAASELQIDLPQSVMIGDKISDVLAGRAAGCRTVLLADGSEERGEADAVVENLLEAVRWVESHSPRMDA